MTYKDKLRDPRWQKKRLEILKRDKWRCKKCKDEKTELHVHHLYYDGEPWEVDNSALVALCAHCHFEVERIQSDNDVSFEDIKIYKSNNWSNGSRIMVLSYGMDTNSFRVYTNDVFVIGFNMPLDTRIGMIKALK